MPHAPQSAPSWPDRPATEVLHALARGELSVERYAAALLERVDEAEPRVQAWAWLDRAAVIEQAREADRLRGQAGAAWPLAGLPVGVKDIIDVRGMPTEDGTVLHAGRVAVRDAALVRRLRDAGAWPMGKTVTTELATYAPGKTRNPHDPAHTPGGSSSGSAAAVAAGMVPLAVGTQTNGSVIRPASFCGVVGFKPSFGLLPRRGALQQSAPLDHVGVFARNVGDAALLAQALAGADPTTRPARLRCRPSTGSAAARVPRPPWPSCARRSGIASTPARARRSTRSSQRSANGRARWTCRVRRPTR